MEEVHVGISLPETSADPDQMRRWLDRFEGDGFDCVELGLDTFPLIIGGEIRHEYAAVIRDLLNERRLRVSGHIGVGVDMRETRAFDVQRKTLLSSIELCATLGINPLVLHFELQSRDAQTEERFLDAHREAAEAAALSRLTLCIENIEVELLAPVLDFVRRVNQPALRLCIDTGHLFLAARFMHFNFLEAFREAVPLLGHLHLNDNTGTFEELRIHDRPRYDQLSMRYRYTFARGDIHIPPFWGRVPFDELFPLLSRYDGLYMCEYNALDFLPFNRGVQEKVRRAVQLARRADSRG